jgi:uncharacterized protein
MTLHDILVVAPYNAQVRTLRAALPPGARVGTVDKFQGQEAPVVFFSMATSSGDNIPRGMTFLFSRNRLNVAVSRAQGLAVVACSPDLMVTRCSSVGQMQLVNMLCEFEHSASLIYLPPAQHPSACGPRFCDEGAPCVHTLVNKRREARDGNGRPDAAE